jgi:Uma2 family endonuclease
MPKDSEYRVPELESVRWNVTQYHNMVEYGVFLNQRTMLIDGRVLEQHHGNPRHPDPRPLDWTREQYRRLGAVGLLTGMRTELIYGEIFRLPPSGWPHVVACYKTASIMRELFRGFGWVNAGHLFGTAESDLYPDVAVLPGSITDYTDHPTVAFLLVEVAENSLKLDTTTKAELYATAGVPDYWVLDVDNRQLHVFRDPQPGGTYALHQLLNETESIAPLAAPDANVTVGDLLPNPE